MAICLADIGLYSCPTGTRGELLTYSIVDSANGLFRDGTTVGSGQPKMVNGTYLYVKHIDQYHKPTPAHRVVFIDEGWATPDSFAVNYEQEVWWDDPPVRHGDGTNVTMADGSTDYWKWRGRDTIRMGKERERGHPGSNYPPTTEDGFKDFYKLQKACWGRLGYSASYPP